MKKIMIVLVLIASLNVCAFGENKPVTKPAMKPGAAKAVESIVDGIRVEQKLQKSQQIDCYKVGNKKLEELGGAIMAGKINDPKEAEFLDRLIGGKDSSMLLAMRRMAAAKYLGCLRDDMMMMGSMHGDKMHENMMEGGCKCMLCKACGMHHGFWGVLGKFIGALLIFALIVFIYSVIFWAVKVWFMMCCKDDDKQKK